MGVIPHFAMVSLRCVLAVVAFCLVVSAMGAARKPDKCHDQVCDGNMILRYNGTCFCEPNPCREMACHDPNYPHLDFEYNSKGALKCFCSKQCPRDWCGGERKPPTCVEQGFHCPNIAKEPILRLVDGKCMCESHPCKDRDGSTCKDPKLPWLDYHWNKDKTLDCFCRPHPCPTLSCEKTPNTPDVLWDQEGNCYCGNRPRTKE